MSAPEPPYDLLWAPASDAVAMLPTDVLDALQAQRVPYLRRTHAVLRVGGCVVRVSDPCAASLPAVVHTHGALSAAHLRVAVAELLHAIAHMHALGVAHG